jgi:hypothetical protein
LLVEKVVQIAAPSVIFIHKEEYYFAPQLRIINAAKEYINNDKWRSFLSLRIFSGTTEAIKYVDTVMLS